jgi:hypothetical protein
MKGETIAITNTSGHQPRCAGLFSQILNLIGRLAFNAGLVRTGAEKRTKGISSWDQFVAMLFCRVVQASDGTVAMNRGYNDYRLFESWSEQNVGFVTRLKTNAEYIRMSDRRFEPRDDSFERLGRNRIETLHQCLHRFLCCRGCHYPAPRQTLYGTGRSRSNQGNHLRPFPRRPVRSTESS